MNVQTIVIFTITGTLPLVAPLLTSAKGSDASRTSSAQEDHAANSSAAKPDARSSLEAFFTAVESGTFDQARERVYPGSPVADGLNDLRQRLVDYRQILPATPAVHTATIYGNATHALAIVPFHKRDGSADAMCLRMTAGQDPWRVRSLDLLSAREALARLKAFRKDYPDAESIPRSESPLIKAKVYESSLDRAAWDVATAQAISYAESHPPKPQFRRPKGLEKLTWDDDFDEIVRRDIARLSHSEPEQRRDAASNLEYMRPFATEACIAALKADDKYARLQATRLLSYEGRGTMSDRTLQALALIIASDPEPIVREAAVRSLRGLENSRAVPVLTTHGIKDPNLSVCLTAVGQLDERGDRAAFAPLAQLLEKVSDWQRQQAICDALVNIDYRAAWPLVMKVAEREDDDYRRFQRLYTASRRPDRYPPSVRHWPKDMDELHQLVRNTYTIAGERYGAKEVQQILEHIDADNDLVRMECGYALGYLRATATVPTLIAHAKKSKNDFVHRRTLMTMGTPEAVEFVARSIRDANQQERRSLLSMLQDSEAGRWAVPLLIVLLDDRGLLYEYPKQTESPWPSACDRHAAHTALVGVFWRVGMKVNQQNLAIEREFDLHEEIRGLKEWWAEHAERFLRDEPVPSPRITSVFWSR